jgi:hypothetical protein
MDNVPVIQLFAIGGVDPSGEGTTDSGTGFEFDNSTATGLKNYK